MGGSRLLLSPVFSARHLSALAVLMVSIMLLSRAVAAESAEDPRLKDGTVPDFATCEGTFDKPPLVTRISRPIVPQDVVWRYAQLAAHYDMNWDVVVDFDVDVQGRPRNIRSVATDPPIIGRAANTTLAAWRFQPAVHNGEATSAHCRTLLSYDLRTSQMKKKQAALDADSGH